MYHQHLVKKANTLVCHESHNTFCMKHSEAGLQSADNSGGAK